jgi:nicotinamide riboside transporter PnuC
MVRGGGPERTEMLTWGVLSFLFLISMVIIGMRRWEGWMFASLTNVGWIIYALVDGVRVVELIFSILGLVVSVIFWLRWNKDQKAKDEAALDSGVSTSA